MTDTIQQFLVSFFQVFKGKVENLSLHDGKVFGAVVWEGESEKQDFTWRAPEDTDLLHAKSLCDYLSSSNLVDGDKIIVTEADLVSRLVSSGWTKENAQSTIDLLCSIAVPMLDDGVETDSFYLHF